MRGETVLRVRSAPGGVDEYGDPVEGSSSQVEIHGCAVSPRESTEITDSGRAGVIVGLTVHAPADADIIYTDLLVVRGETYKVEGQPGLWVSPFTGTRAGLQVALSRVEG